MASLNDKFIVLRRARLLTAVPLSHTGARLFGFFVKAFVLSVVVAPTHMNLVGHCVWLMELKLVITFERGRRNTGLYE